MKILFGQYLNGRRYKKLEVPFGSLWLQSQQMGCQKAMHFRQRILGGYVIFSNPSCIVNMRPNFFAFSRRPKIYLISCYRLWFTPFVNIFWPILCDWKKAAYFCLRKWDLILKQLSVCSIYFIYNHQDKSLPSMNMKRSSLCNPSFLNKKSPLFRLE